MNELQRLLGLTKQIQDGESYHVAVAASTGSVRCVCPLCQLRRVDLAALRTQLQQHARAVKELTSAAERDASDGDQNWACNEAEHRHWQQLGDRYRDIGRAAADFLAPEDQ